MHCLVRNETASNPSPGDSADSADSVLSGCGVFLSSSSIALSAIEVQESAGAKIRDSWSLGRNDSRSFELLRTLCSPAGHILGCPDDPAEHAAANGRSILA